MKIISRIAVVATAGGTPLPAAPATHAAGVLDLVNAKYVPVSAFKRKHQR